jgi:hypothetical protein
MTGPNISAMTIPDEIISLTAAQQQFAEVLGRLLARKWAQQQNLKGKACLGSSETQDQVLFNGPEQNQEVHCCGT